MIVARCRLAYVAADSANLQQHAAECEERKLTVETMDVLTLNLRKWEESHKEQI